MRALLRTLDTRLIKFHLVLASGKLVLQKSSPIGIFLSNEVTLSSSDDEGTAAKFYVVLVGCKSIYDCRKNQAAVAAAAINL